MIVLYVLERFWKYVKHKLREIEAAKRRNGEESNKKEEENNKKMDKLVDVVVDAAKARVLEALREEEQRDESGNDIEGKEMALIGLH